MSVGPQSILYQAEMSSPLPGIQSAPGRVWSQAKRLSVAEQILKKLTAGAAWTALVFASSTKCDTDQL